MSHLTHANLNLFVNTLNHVFFRTIMFAIPLLFSMRAGAQLEGTYQVIIKKQEEKKNSRWSLANWMAIKEKNRLMDLWLAENSHSSMFEFFLEGSSLKYALSSNGGAAGEERDSIGARLAAYAGVAGLRGQYWTDSDQNRKGWRGSLNLRVLGRALQDTHFNLGYGLSETNLGASGATENWSAQFAEVSLNLYMTKALGLEGTYQKFFPSESNKGRSSDGEEAKVGLFIDFGFLRLFGNWNHEFSRIQAGPGESDTSAVRRGFGGGLRFYF